MTAKHYENFPVASIVLPRRYRQPVGVIYRFAREADDIADEGDATAEERLAGLSAYKRGLEGIAAGRPEGELFIQLAEVVARHKLPLEPFHDLLSAFSQDVTKHRYANFAEVMDYCRRSANPVGRLLLCLFGQADDRNLAYSDAICSSLQLINFLQDIAIDCAKGRIYLPQDDMARYGISEKTLAEGRTDGMWRPFILSEIERARKLLSAGAPLGKRLPGRIGLEIRLIVAGGATILAKLHKNGGDVFDNRPTLGATDWLAMGWKALRAR